MSLRTLSCIALLSAAELPSGFPANWHDEDEDHPVLFAPHPQEQDEQCFLQFPLQRTWRQGSIKHETKTTENASHVPASVEIAIVALFAALVVVLVSGTFEEEKQHNTGGAGEALHTGLAVRTSKKEKPRKVHEREDSCEERQPIGDTGGTSPRGRDDDVSSAVSSSSSRVSCSAVLFAFIVYLPLQVVMSVTFILIWIVTQILVFPFRLCGGRPLAFAMNLTAPLMSCLTCIFVTVNKDESCYGCEMDDFGTFDDFLQACSAIKRKNIKRNYYAAAKVLEENATEVSFHPAGSWRITPEIRALLWQQCLRHVERAEGYADITSCWQPLPPWAIYVGGLMLLLAFPCDLQTFRTPDGTLFSLNTRVHIGNVYFNPNFATLDEYSREGIYAWVHWHLMHEAIRVRVSVVNLNPSMGAAKQAVGCYPISLTSLICASLSCSRLPQKPEDKQKIAETQVQSVPGGKSRSARKRREAEAKAEGEEKEAERLRQKLEMDTKKQEERRKKKEDAAAREAQKQRTIA